MKRYKAVVLGAGARGRAHTLAFLKNADRFDLAAVCDLDTDRMKAMLAGINVSLPIYASADEMLAREKPDVFCFVTPPAIRLELVKLGVRHGVKVIAYEKPMATSLAEAKEICDACDAAGIKHIVCHQHKYGGHWQAVKKIVESGRIGKVRSVHATSKGWFFHYITHLVDYAMWLIDYPKPQWVVGHMHGRGKVADNHPSPDYIMAQVGFAGEIRGFFECGTLAPSRGIPEHFWLDAGATVLGTHGYAEVIVGKGWRAMTADKGYVEDYSVSFDESGNTAPYITDLGKWLDDPSQPHPCRGELAYRGFEVSMAILASGLDPRTIVLPMDVSAPILERMVAELPEDNYQLETT
ncbi:MAG: Gfo/Idh/MocA family oxidoreductase [Planctomycetaceae bacterium]|nr:Gfo/Idh/MocA family oxidoreductase [Planctomycetaceae bacterium]